jgi:hypothetical protein
MTAPASLTVGLADLQAEIAALYFGQEQTPPYSVLTTGSPAPLTATQVLQTNRCIRDGMMSVYSAWRWSFLRPRITITTIAPYSTGTVTVNSSGFVTLNNGTAPSDGGFPSNAVTGSGMVYIPANSTTGFVGGSWFVGTYTSATSITLSSYTAGAIPAASIMLTAPVSGNYTLSWNGNTTGNIASNAPASTIQTALNLLAGAAFTVSGTYPNFVITGDAGNPLAVASGTAVLAVSGVPYTLSFNLYPVPSGTVKFDGDFTPPASYSNCPAALENVSEVEIRHRLAHNCTPHNPHCYALVTNLYAPTVNPASTKSVTFYPIPNAVRTYTGIGRIVQTALDATNQYPLGGDVLAPVLLEAVLAAAERNLEQKDAEAEDAVHNRKFRELLALAIQQDKEESTPDTVGIDHGAHCYDRFPARRRVHVETFWNAGGGYSGYL